MLWLGFGLVHLAVAAWFVTSGATGSDAAWKGFPLDDAWIHLVYARSLGFGQGPAYNPGELEAGFSSPLWMLALLPATWLGALTGQLALWVKLTGVVVATAGSVLACRLVEALTRARGPAVLAGMLLALEPGLSFARVSGMEVPLAVATILLALLGLCTGDLRRAGLGLALAPLARPELAILTALGGLALVWELAPREAADGEVLPAAPLRDWAWALLPSVVAGGAWMLYCLVVTGRPLPNTFYAKFQVRDGAVEHSVGLLFGEVMPSWAYFAFGSGLVLVLVGAAWLLMGSQTGGAGTPLPVRLVLVVLAPALLLGLAQAHDLQQALPFYWARYVQPVSAPLVVLLVLGVHALWDPPERVPAAVPRIALRGLAVVALLVPLPRLVSQLLEHRERYAWNCQNIQEIQVAAATWVREHSEPDDVVAAVDAGAMRYFSDRTVLDLNGLNDHRVAAGELDARMAELEPRFFAVFPSAFALFAGNPHFRPVHRVQAEHYTICECDQDVMVVVERR